jgi:hypothetical protein
MASTRAITDPPAKDTILSKLRDYYILTKPEVNLLILMTTSPGYYLGSSGPLRMGRLFITLAGTLLVASGDPQSVDGERLRRSDAAYRKSAFGLWQTQSPAGLLVWADAECRRRRAPGGVGQRGIGFAGDRNPAGLFVGLYATEEEDAAVYSAGCCTRRHAYSHRLGGCIERRRRRLLAARGFEALFTANRRIPCNSLP